VTEERGKGASPRRGGLLIAPEWSWPYTRGKVSLKFYRNWRCPRAGRENPWQLGDPFSSREKEDLLIYVAVFENNIVTELPSVFNFRFHAMGNRLRRTPSPPHGRVRGMRGERREGREVSLQGCALVRAR